MQPNRNYWMKLFAQNNGILIQFYDGLDDKCQSQIFQTILF